MAGMRRSLMEMGVWAKRVRIRLGSTYEDVVVQTIGDRTAALEHGHEAMQRMLLEFRADGERFAALTEALRLSPVEDVAAFVAEGEAGALAERLAREMPDPVEPRQDVTAGENTSDFAERHRQWESQCQELQGRRQEQLQQRLRQRVGELCSAPKEHVIELARARRIDVECWNAFQQACDDWVLYEGTRLADDPARLYFSSVDEVQRLHPEVRAQLAAAYRELEMPATVGLQSEPMNCTPDDLPKDCCATAVS
jgi:hypothetical protein